MWKAVGNGKGRIELAIKDPRNEGARQCGKGSKEFVNLCTIDSLNLERLDFLKLEVNGMELAALAGAEKTLERCRPKILIELWDEASGTEWLKAHQYAVEHFDGLNYFAVPLEQLAPPKKEEVVFPLHEGISESESLET